MDIGEHTGGVWAPPPPETAVTYPPNWGQWPPPAGRRRPGWLIGGICALAGVVVVSTVAVLGFVVGGLASYPSRWDPRVAGLAAFVEESRGLEFRHPVHVDFLTEPSFVATVTTEKADLSEAERRDLEDYEAASRALGLAGAGTDLFAAENTLSGEGILAYYDSEMERVTVRGTELTVGVRVTLVHELVHALQDQHFDLSRHGTFATDARNAVFEAVVEGDATSIENFYYWSLPETERAAFDAEEAGQIAAMEESTAAVPGWMNASAQAPYVLGEAFVTALVAARGPEAVDEALRNPPASEEQLMDVARFLAGDEPEKVDPPDLEPGDELIEETDFGTLDWLFMLAERIPAPDALVAADGWGGDASVVFERDGQVCAGISYVGDTARDTDEMAGALERWADGMERATVRRSGSAVELVSCDPGAEAVRPAPSGGGRGAEAAMMLLMTRASTFAGVLDSGAGEAEAACVATGMLREFTPDELLAAELPADFETRRAGLAEGCATTTA
ncbi:MAG: hypothetical protein ACRDZ7_16115 [Acidimicrobiia bacterium]